MAGLLAARILSDHFEQVTVIEHDQLTDDAEPSKGVPQGRHIHVLLAGKAGKSNSMPLRDLLQNLDEL